MSLAQAFLSLLKLLKPALERVLGLAALH